MIAAPIQLRQLPRPTTLVNRNVEDGLFRRLSVAYCLRAFNRGPVSGPNELVGIVPENSRANYDSGISQRTSIIPLRWLNVASLAHIL